MNGQIRVSEVSIIEDKKKEDLQDPQAGPSREELAKLLGGDGC